MVIRALDSQETEVTKTATQVARRVRTTGVVDDPLWYKDAVIYELRTPVVLRLNGDGIGDFGGLAEKLDYIKDLGVTAIWLLPLYPVARQGRRLRHRRLHGRAPRRRDAARLRRADRRGAPARHPASSPSW